MLKMNRVMRSAIILLILFSLSGCYLIKQANSILAVNGSAKKIDILLEDDCLPDSIRETLLLVKEIKSFAVNRLGLKDDKNYTTFVNINKDYLVDVVSACKKDAFIPYTWWYPFFGSFPYKGFFDRQDALAEADALRKKDLDVIVRKVDAFSTLGFFTDPVYSYMTKYSVYSLASLIIHEQTHATIWLNNYVQFNEECASFVEQEGAMLYIREKFGENSDEYREAVSDREDQERFVTFIKTIYHQLDLLYKMEINTACKREARGYIINAYKDRFRAIGYREYSNQNYKNIAKAQLNNAYIMLFITYSGDLSLFYNLYEKMKYDLASTINFLKKLKDFHGDPKEYLRNLNL